jgi:DNA-binding XRE family transcriptional regulator
MAQALLRQWGKNIRQCRQLRNEDGGIRRKTDPEMSQATLGRLLDPPVTQATVSRWEDGKMEPRLAYKLQIAAALGVAPSALFPLPAAPE